MMGRPPSPIVTIALAGRSLVTAGEARPRPCLSRSATTGTASNPLGAFVYTSVGGSNLIGSITYPNNQTTSFSYYTNTGDHRLQEINNLEPNSSLISQFQYSYDAASRVLQWAENNPALSGSESYSLGYDGSDELTSAQLSNTNGIVNFYAYAYDGAENRINSQANSAVSTPVVNDLNQLTTLSGGGNMVFSGTLDEPASVTINGNAATNPSPLSFSGTAAVTTGTNLITITATDASSQTNTHQYDVTVPAVSGTYAYDLNGNLTSDGVNTYGWDAANRLISITEPGSLSTQITYDGLGRRAQIVETSGSTVTSTKNLLWYGTELCEERNASDTVTKRYYPQGVQISGSNYYYTLDHLGSIREVTDSNAVVQARYDYDPYGQQTQLSGTMSVDFGYAGLYRHQPSGLLFGTYRGYSPTMQRWISRDPIGALGGINLYGYVGNEPVGYVDPLGNDRYVFQQRGGLHAGLIYPDGSGGWLQANFGANGLSITPADDPSGDPKAHRIPSTPDQDKNLRDTLENIRQGKQFNPFYDPFTWNCRHFTDRHKNDGIPGAGFPWSTLVPIYPPVRP